MHNLLTTPSSADPDERRRGKLFNIFLLGLAVPVLALLGINLYEAITRSHPDAPAFVLMDFVSLIILVALSILHRFRPKWARHAFLLFLALIPVNAFDIRGLDRVLVTLTIPVMVSGFLIRPSSSYFYAAVVSLAYSAVVLRSFVLGEWGDYNLSYVFNYPSVLSTFGIAFVIWIVSRSLDQALSEARERAEELRVLNEELDQRVQGRTWELAKALEREHAMAVRNQTILESIGDGVLVTDGNGRVILSNPAANRLARTFLESTSLHKALDGVRPEVLAQLEEYMAEDTGDERPNIQFEWNRRTVAANVAPIQLDIPGPTHISGGHVMVLRDITREAELDRMKTIFLGSVSHELRTPMTAIKGYIELVLDLEAERLSETGRKYVEVVSTNIKRLLALANDLIDMSRIEVGELALYREWAELAPLVMGAVDTVKMEFEKRGLSLTVQIEPDLPLLYLDRHRITQVLLNLLTNAYKYTIKGGATVKVGQADQMIKIEISDTGVGMTKEEQARVFERFFRSGHEVVQKAGGSGLGLTITKSMVELHGGQILCESEYNLGTTFTISLPVNVPEPA